MRVVLPMLTFVPGGMGGSETYAREVVAALARFPDLELTVLVSPAAAGFFEGATEIVVDRVSGGSGTADRLRTLAQASAPGPKARAALAQADVIHHMFTVPVPGRRGTPRVVTLLDVQHRDLPEMFSRAERAYRSIAYDASARHADRVLTISEFAKRTIVDQVKVPADRIDVAPLGVDHRWFTPSPIAREEFVYYPAAAWPHKNHALLLDAMSLVRVERPDLTLVLTGGLREKLGHLPEWVDHRGHVDREAVRDLYRRAGCVVFPSLYEGFGLPPLEAMATGCPAAVARSGALVETCGDAAATFAPTDVGDMARAIDLALRHDPKFIDRGHRRAEMFTWAACAEAHVRAYQIAVSSG